jgi:Ser/Thr protein kinase RdoA (MazF antagonist)
VVFQVGAVAVKVHPPGTDPMHLAQVHAVLGALPIAVTSDRAPVVTTSGVVSVAPWLSSQPSPGRAAWTQLGEALRALHDHPGADRLPAWTPLRRLPAQLEHLDARSAARLAAARSAVLAGLADLQWVLPAGALHGDVSTDNVLATPDGPRWIDLDFACHGRREYDLSAVVRRRATGQLPERDYRAFCRSYGADLAGWPGLRVLDDVCALSGLGFRLWLDRRASRPSDWLGAELDRLSERVPAAR